MTRVHDASQGYSVWTEELRGHGENWFFVMPNLYSKHPDGKPFAGVAIRLTHGVAISWDGRIIRHCTSLSEPDGPDGKRVGAGEGGHGNHLYGTFTAAKERVVSAGRTLSERALQSKLSPQSGECDDRGESSDGDCLFVGKKRRRRRKKKRRRGRCATATVVAVDDVAVVVCGAPRPVECRAVASEAALMARALSTATVSSAMGRMPMTARDLDVGGAYRIFKEKMGLML